ncbi:MAG: glycerate kinase [Immundisolibacterales bacterium]|nr:glycerate kinase [Immundisolibacterales bacterium]
MERTGGPHGASGTAGQDPEGLLRRMFAAAVDSVRADACVPPALPEPAGGRTVVVGAGKAAAAMARAVERTWSARGHPPPDGVVVTRYGHGVDCRHIEVIEAAHPVPDAAGRKAAERILALAAGLGGEDLLLCLVSGGGSALLAAPAPGVTLDDKQAINRALLASGANITEMNTVRKHLSRIKGGRLAAASHPARCHAVLLSDVPGDDPATIASGPTVADPTTVADARQVAERYGVPIPDPVAAWWERGESETPKAGDPSLARSTVEVVANAQRALEAAARVAREAGFEALILGDAIEGEAREAALVHAGIARQARRWGQPARPPCVLLSGGETTVTVRGGGRGGRNAEFLLALAAALDDLPGVFALAADTDGIDGTESNAGAVYRPGLMAQAHARGLDPRAALAANDGYGFFAALGALVETGPTLTNVNDFRAVLVAGEAA